MTVRAIVPAIAEPLVRPSARVRTVAAMLDCHESQIRRMVAKGQLEAHRAGAHSIRVFLDSVENWQATTQIRPVSAALGQSPAPSSTPSRATKAAHRQAMERLRALGLV